jgi:hypothetical protein
MQDKNDRLQFIRPLVTFVEHGIGRSLGLHPAKV